MASVLGDADRRAVDAGLMGEEGIRIELVDPDPDVYRMAYDVVSNATLWFCHHHLFDAARRPRSNAHWMRAWDAYREYNRLFADRVAEIAPVGGRVLVQDYHLCLVGAELASRRPDLRTAHFSHTPFADPSVLACSPTPSPPSSSPAWPVSAPAGSTRPGGRPAYRACQAELGRPRGHPTFVSALSPTPPAWPTPWPSRPSPGPARRSTGRSGVTDRRVIVRVDRMELSKNLLRGFWAFEELLERRPDWRGAVVFVALAYPSRQGLAEYLAYQNEVEGTVHRINERWGTPGLDADRAPRSGTTTPGRWPPSPATTCCWSTPSATG